MLKPMTLLGVLIVLGATTARGENWAERLFETKSHNFGTVARAAKTDHVFEFVNTTDRDIRISSVRTSCGCTTPTILTSVVAPGETGKIHAKFNTHSFFGQRGATVTATFTSPSYAEVYLRVDGYVRRDVVFDPGEIDFGSVAKGKESVVNVDVQYAGRADWRIVDIKSTNPSLEFRVVETKRQYGRVAYNIEARLRDDATPGFFNESIYVVTNDQRRPNVPLELVGHVTRSISITPESIFLGSEGPREEVQKRLVVKSTNPIEIKRIECSDPRVAWEIPEGSKTIHIVTLKLTPDNDAKPFNAEVNVFTSDESEKPLVIKIHSGASANLASGVAR